MKRKYNHPIEVTMDVVCGKWKAVILCHLLDRTLRFNELRKRIPAITQKMLTQQLKELMEDGLVCRKAYTSVPPRVEYSLTEYGFELKETLRLMTEWGSKHLGKVGDEFSEDAESENTGTFHLPTDS